MMDKPNSKQLKVSYTLYEKGGTHITHTCEKVFPNLIECINYMRSAVINRNSLCATGMTFHFYDANTRKTAQSVEWDFDYPQ